MQRFENDEAGFTILEVAMAAVITTVGLVFLATLFTLGIAQNRMVKQYTTTTALAQQKLEELNAVEKTSAKLTIGGGLTEATKKTNYCDTVFVNPDTGVVTTDIPQG